MYYEPKYMSNHSSVTANVQKLVMKVLFFKSNGRSREPNVIFNYIILIFPMVLPIFP